MTNPSSSQARRYVPLWKDLSAAAFLVGVSTLLWIWATPYQRLSASHPYLVGFGVFALLSTFGEAVSLRLTQRRWLPDRLFRRAALWGLLGIWISAVFPFQAGGVAALVDAKLWPRISAAFSTSLWANILSGFGFFMMLAHYWAEKIITGRWVAPWMIFADPGFIPWARVVLSSLVLFWLPAHTVTFLLPGEARALFAAYLGILLGMLLKSKG